MGNRYDNFEQTVKCPNCGETTEDAEVTVDTMSGVAAFECPECGQTQEPNPK